LNNGLKELEVNRRMSPRTYQLGERQITIAQTRARILEAAYQLLLLTEDANLFTIEAIARQAEVARMTIYYQFGSKLKLLEALCDGLAVNTQAEQLAAAFELADPVDALAEYIRRFGQIWDRDRLATRRLRAYALLDRKLEQIIREQDEQRRAGIAIIIERLAAAERLPPDSDLDELSNLLYLLVSFESFDNLAGEHESCEAIAPSMQRLAHSMLGLTFKMLAKPTP